MHGAIIFRKRDCSALREVILHANLVNSNVVRAVRRRGNVANGANQHNSNYCLNGALLSQGSERNRNTIRLESAW